MDLSIVIVNYNVKYFLEQCLISVQEGIGQLKCEVFVVDNNSVDGSTEMIKEKFPWVKLIISNENLGFSRGNNLAIKKASGKYILLLNPDTVIEEDTLNLTLAFMENHEDAGGLGVKMIDGSGNFLPESKRGLPTPKIAFFKIFGLAKIFPKSEKFGAYHLTYLDKNKNHKVDVLAGAFMMIRKEVLDKIGLLDETFFMYGEDIDLSYRIKLAGYNNYYCSDTTIIHYKGESTKKSSINYVIVFYKAMQIFAKKHFLTADAKLFTFLINLAIYLRAGISIFKRIFDHLTPLIVDYLAITIGLFYIKEWYQNFSGINYPSDLSTIGIFAYALIWIVSIFFCGGYDKPVSLKSTAKGVFYGFISILSVYALVSEEFRFSRAFILIGMLHVGISTTLIRWILDKFKVKHYALTTSVKKRIAIMASHSEFERIKFLLGEEENYTEIKHLPFNSENIEEFLNIHNINELIFSGNDGSAAEIIQKMNHLSNKKISFKIVPKLQTFVIGSDSIETTGDIYTALKYNKISQVKNKRDKRILDILISLIILITLPVNLILFKNKKRFLRNTINILVGNKTFVGYTPTKLNPLLPKIKKGILTPPGIDTIKSYSNDEINITYARNYSYIIDLKHIINNFSKLDVVV